MEKNTPYGEKCDCSDIDNLAYHHTKWFNNKSKLIIFQRTAIKNCTKYY